MRSSPKVISEGRRASSFDGVSSLAVHGFGAGLVGFRVCHAIGLKADSVSNPLRGIGAGGSTLVVVVASIWAIVTFF